MRSLESLLVESMKFFMMDKTVIVLKKIMLEEFKSLQQWHQALHHQGIADILSSSERDGTCFSFEH